MPQSFRVVALDRDHFLPLFALDDPSLRQRGIRRLTATSDAGFPCRISLRDASAGESLLLLTYPHHDVPGPYRSSGPIYVREEAATAQLAAGEVPEVAAGRQLSVRAYGVHGMMRDARVCPGEELADTIQALFEDPKANYLQVHNALPGCFSCQVVRA